LSWCWRCRSGLIERLELLQGQDKVEFAALKGFDINCLDSTHVPCI
jgi:hypothetical protein